MSVRFLLCFAAGLLLFAAAARAETIIIDSDTTIRGTIDDNVLIIGTSPPERPPVVNFLEPAVLLSLLSAGLVGWWIARRARRSPRRVAARSG